MLVNPVLSRCVDVSLSGHVGAPLPCAMVKVVDIPEMNYFAKNGDGEVSKMQSRYTLPDSLVPADTPLGFVPLDLYSWPQCVQRLPEGPRKDIRSLGQRRLAAQWGRGPVASSKIKHSNQPVGDIYHLLASSQRANVHVYASPLPERDTPNH